MGAGLGIIELEVFECILNSSAVSCNRETGGGLILVHLFSLIMAPAWIQRLQVLQLVMCLGRTGVADWRRLVAVSHFVIDAFGFDLEAAGS